MESPEVLMLFNHLVCMLRNRKTQKAPACVQFELEFGYTGKSVQFPKYQTRP